MTKIYVIMGVSGSGKSTIGKEISQKFGFAFFDGDSFHSQQNIDKMSKGISLEDTDREPWLKSINLHMQRQDKATIYACSALKEKYRKLLSHNIKSLNFIYLKGDFNLIYNRIEKRKGHFMSSQMLQSQFDTLEEPENAIEVDIRNSIEDIIKNIKVNLK